MQKIAAPVQSIALQKVGVMVELIPTVSEANKRTYRDIVAVLRGEKIDRTLEEVRGEVIDLIPESKQRPIDFFLIGALENAMCYQFTDMEICLKKVEQAFIQIA